MPLYDYRCPAGHTTELLRRIAEAADPVTCACGQPATRAVERSQFYMRYDATQLGAPKHPGMSGCQNPARGVPAGRIR